MEALYSFEEATMSKTKSLFSLSLFALFLLVPLAHAQQQSYPVAVIDASKVFESSLEGKKAISQLRDKEQKIKDELAGVERQAQAIQTRLSTQKLTLNLETQQQLAADLDNLRTKRQRMEEDYTKEFRLLEFNLTNKIKAEILPIIETVAKEKGFSLVLDLAASGVAYFHPTIDLTQEVVERYNASKSVPK
jgi:Skp family chaperone for outer membrane proteins